MATSSLLEHIRVNNPKAVEEFVAAMEASAKKPPQPRTEEQKMSVPVLSPIRRGFGVLWRKHYRTGAL